MVFNYLVQIKTPYPQYLTKLSPGSFGGLKISRPSLTSLITGVASLEESSNKIGG